MDAVQRLRLKAQANNKLGSNKQQTVTTQQQGDKQAIVIAPTQPDTLYVPYYDPGVVYGAWYYPTYPPYYWPAPGYIAAGVIGTGLRSAPVTRWGAGRRAATGAAGSIGAAATSTSTGTSTSTTSIAATATPGRTTRFTGTACATTTPMSRRSSAAIAISREPRIAWITAAAGAIRCCSPVEERATGRTSAAVTPKQAWSIVGAGGGPTVRMRARRQQTEQSTQRGRQQAEQSTQRRRQPAEQSTWWRQQAKVGGAGTGGMPLAT